MEADHRLVRVGLKGKEIAVDKRPVSNIVFLIDVWFDAAGESVAASEGRIASVD